MHGPSGVVANWNTVVMRDNFSLLHLAKIASFCHSANQKTFINDKICYTLHFFQYYYLSVAAKEKITTRTYHMYVATTQNKFIAF
jgi:hypothetical protein